MLQKPKYLAWRSSIARLRSFYSSQKHNYANSRHNTQNPALYSISALIALFGVAYAFSPLYKLLCQATGLGGVPRPKDFDVFGNLFSFFARSAAGQGSAHVDGSSIPRIDPQISGMQPIKVTFMTTTGPLLPWKFVPTQKSVYVRPGETALAFFTASNLSPERDITGVSTYSVAPHAAASFLTKIQCFCFEQQRLAAGETVDMPVYFYLDPNIREGHYSLKNLDEITLSYTFFAVDKMEGL